MGPDAMILVLWAGIEPAPLELETQSLNHWTTKHIAQLLFYKQEAGDLGVGAFILSELGRDLLISMGGT